MTEGKSETDLATDLASLAELLPTQAKFVMGAANSASKKLKRVVRATLTTPVSLKDPVGTYTFNQPIFVRVVHIYGPDISALKSSLTLTTVGVDGVRSERRLAESGKGTSNHFAFVSANSFLKSIEIKIGGKQTAPVTRIGFTGYRIEEIEELSGRLRQGLDLRRDLDAYSKGQTAAFAQAQQRLAAVTAEIAAAGGTKEELTDEVSTLETQKTQGEAALATVRSAQADEQKTLDALIGNVTAAKNNESQLKTDVRSLNEEIGELKREMRELENDRSVISDEYRDYVKEGQGQAKLYAIIASVCLGASLIGAGILVWGAAHYLEPRVTSTSEAYALFVQRLPFTAAFAATIALLLKLADYLIKGVYAIHQSRLTLARLLVLAKDTVYSSAADLDVSDAERLKERVRLKVDLLRQYLSAELGAKLQATKMPAAEQKKPDGDDDDEPSVVSGSGVNRDRRQ